MPRAARSVTWTVLASLLMVMAAHPAHAIPAFARQYRTGCTTCHTAPPKLNVLGEAFRLNGYRLPENALLTRRESPIPLGEDPWKDLWPRAIWPGELASTAPLALRAVSDATLRRVAPANERIRLRMPRDVYLLAGGTFGDGISAFVEAEWEDDGGVEVVQAKVLFQDPIPWLPNRRLNVLVGRQSLYLLTLGDRVLDRSGRRSFAWQSFGTSGATLAGHAGDAQWRMSDAAPGVSANGLVGGRLFYSLGAVQVGSDGGDDRGRPLGAYYTLRYKWGGLRLDGGYDSGGGPGAKGYGQLLDRAVILETFGFRATEALAERGMDRQRAAGVALRILNGATDIGMGYVRRSDRGAWGDDGHATMSSVFAKAEYLVFPWLIGSLKAERFRLRATGVIIDRDPSETTLVPAVTMLVRQNVRTVIEGELFTAHSRSRRAEQRRPHALSVLLEFAF
ncbi:MAG: hypothetical protein ABMA00_13805 [Gemmatimonas sp.]